MPGAGDNFLVVEDDRIARQIAETRAARERNAALAQARGRRTLEDFLKPLEKGEVQELKLILKGDVSGSVEALEDALLKIDVSDEVSLRIIDRGVGAITENDVNLADASDAVIIGFNVRPAERRGQELADREGVDVRYYSVIYQAIDEVEAALKGLLKPEYEEVAARHRRGPRGLPLEQVRQHRRLRSCARASSAATPRRASSATARSSPTTSPSSR